MRSAALLVLVSLSLFAPAAVRADQYVSGGKVVHTRLAPVVMHRLSPPFRGRHVYSGRR